MKTTKFLLGFSLLLIASLSFCGWWSDFRNKTYSTGDKIFNGVASTTGDVSGYFFSHDPGTIVSGNLMANMMEPTFEKFAGQMNTVVDRLDEHLQQRITQVDVMLTNKIGLVDEVLNKNILLLDTVIGKNLLIANDLLEKENKALDQLLEKQDNILKERLGQFDDITKKRVEEVNSIVEDKIPFAFREVTKELEWTIFFSILLVVFVGIGGYFAFKSFYLNKDLSFVKRIKQSNTYAISQFKGVALPIIIVGCIIQLTYFFSGKITDTSIIKKIETLAEQSETGGDYSTAALYRARVNDLYPNKSRYFMVQKDVFLANLFQTDHGFNSNNFKSDDNFYSALAKMDSLQVKTDQDIQSVMLFNKVRLLAKNGPSDNVVMYKDFISQVSTDFANYDKTFANKESTLSYYHYLANLTFALLDYDKTQIQRLGDAIEVSKYLEEKFPTNIVAQLTLSQLLIFQYDLEEFDNVTKIDNPKSDIINYHLDLARKLDNQYTQIFFASNYEFDSTARATLYQYSVSTDKKEDYKKGLDSVIEANFITIGEIFKAGIKDGESFSKLYSTAQLTKCISSSIAEEKLKHLDNTVSTDLTIQAKGYIEKIRLALDAHKFLTAEEYLVEFSKIVNNKAIPEDISNEYKLCEQSVKSATYAKELYFL